MFENANLLRLQSSQIRIHIIRDEIKARSYWVSLERNQLYRFQSRVFGHYFMTSDNRVLVNLP